jgi:LacI family transcriptional regulator
VTIRDVAERASVSTMTVSRVINNGSSVRPETRAKVEEAIRALNYAPNAAAQRLAGGRRLRMALLYDNPSSGFLSELLLGALDESVRAGAQLAVLKYDESAGATGLLEALEASGGDAVLLPPPLCESEPVLQALAKANVAMVGLAPGRPSGVMSTVRIDNERAAREIADHLLALDHRRFALIGGHPNQTVSEQRRWGFVDQLGRAGVPPSSIVVGPGSFTYRSGLEAAERLLSAERRPTAIFAANDDMAAADHSVAHRLSIDVPRELSVVGFDDTPLASELWPPLTTIRQPLTEMAEMAVKLLVEAVRRPSGASEHQDLVVPHALIVRGSTGPTPLGG